MQHEVYQHSIKSEVKSTVSLGLPLIASQLIYACSGFIATAMVAKLGKEALAASVLLATIWWTVSSFFFGILNAVSVLVSHQHGAKNHAALSKVMGAAHLLGFVIMFLVFAALSGVPWLLRLSAQSPAVILLTTQYLHAMYWTIPSLVSLIISEQFLAGIGHAKIVLKISILVVPIEILLIYVFIFGKLHLPACGISGVGYGFAITYGLTAVGLIVYLQRSKKFHVYKVFAHIFYFNKQYLREFIRVGAPLGFMSVIEVSTFGAMTLLMARFGTTFLAAHQIVMQYLGFAITIVFAMSQAVTIRVGHAVGKQDTMGVKYATYVGMLLNLLWMLPIAGIFYFFPNWLLRLDLNLQDPRNVILIHDTIVILSIASVLLIFENFRIIGVGALRGLKDTHYPMYISCVSFWGVGITLAFLLSVTKHMSGVGIWWGITLGIIFCAVIILLRLQYRLRQLDGVQLRQLSLIQ